MTSRDRRELAVHVVQKYPANNAHAIAKTAPRSDLSHRRQPHCGRPRPYLFETHDVGGGLRPYMIP